jgi:hypothetical protein
MGWEEKYVTHNKVIIGDRGCLLVRLLFNGFVVYRYSNELVEVERLIFVFDSGRIEPQN